MNELLRHQDKIARLTAQREFEHPLILEAGAGTGKTTTLIARLLVWALGPGWDRAVQRQAERKTDPKKTRKASDAEPERLAADVLGRVVAITFTEAAAAEMAQRAARELGNLARGETPAWLDDSLLPASPDERSRRARALLGTLDHLAVRTIHAFCLGLLAGHPLEAGVHPLLTVDADGRLVEDAVREAVEGALRRGYGDPGDPHLLALAVRGYGAREIVEALVTLVHAGLPSSELNRNPFEGESLAGFRRRLTEACGALQWKLAARLRGSKLRIPQEVQKGVQTLHGRLIEDPNSGVAAWQEWTAELLPENLIDRLKEWGKRKLGKTEEGLLGEIREELGDCAATLHRLLDHLTDLDPELLEAARQGLAPILAEVEKDLQARGIATFDSLLTGAAAFLQKNPSERARVRRGIDQLLVDEFQDTDRIQCEILRWIALDGPEPERPGLFLVGDPKQSIYGWRSADLRAYAGFVQLAKDHGGKVMALVENFRSVPRILDEVTRVIEPVMRHREGLQPPFERLLPCERRAAEPGFERPAASSGGGQPYWSPVEHWVSWKALDADGKDTQCGAKTPATVAAELEAAALSADVRTLHERENVAWRQIAVLLRGIGDLDTYLEALRRAGVPFQVGRDRQYYRRREVIEAAALVRAVVDPGDHLALLTVLRSALVGVPDAALIPLWNRQFPRRMTELASPDPAALGEIADLIREAARRVPAAGVPGIERVRGWETGLLAAVEHLAELRQSFETEPSDLFVERLRTLTLIEPVEAARYLGPYRLANLNRFFRQLLAAIEDGGGDVTAILRALRKSVAEAREAEEGRPQEGVEDAVQVLTIHGAKGLDFEHVYLVQLHKAPPPGDRTGRTEVGRLDDGTAANGNRFEYRLFGAATLGFDQIEAERREVEAAERVRLLYVAMTRAKDRLVLAGTWPDEIEPRPWEHARSPMDLLLSRTVLPADLAASWSDGIDQKTWSFLDDAGALWKFPALRPESETLATEETEGPDLPEPEAIALAAGALEVKREEAHARMDRPFSGAASEEAHHLLREEQAEARVATEVEETRQRRKGKRTPEQSREAAMAAGGAIHRVLETWDLTADPRKEAGRQRSLLPEYLAALVEGETLDQALPRALDLLDQFLEGPLLARFRNLNGHVLARELPVLLPPTESPTAPIGVIAGAIDLLYRDPETKAVVIADYKTDDLETEADLNRRAATYAHQGVVYVRALQDALELDQPPRFELWFLRAGRVVGVGDKPSPKGAT